MHLIKKTSLEKTSNVADTLSWKLKTIGEKNPNKEIKLADYIASGIENLNNKLDYIKSEKADLDAVAKDTKEQIEFIQVEGAKFFKNAGIEKLEGVRCSSITLTKEKKESETEVKKTVFTPLISQAEIEELLIGLGKAEMREVVETKVTKYYPPKLKINKRRKSENSI